MTRAALATVSIAAAAVAGLAQSGPGTAAPTRALERPAPDAAADMRVLPVQRNVYMLASDAGNSAVQVGPDGVLVVDTSHRVLAPKLLAAIRTLTDAPIHTIVNTHIHADHTGGNEALFKLGPGGRPARVMAHENVFNKMVADAAAANANTPMAALPMNAYFAPTRDFSLNGEAILLHHAPAAHTDGDTIVHFRGSDVVSAGDLFSPDLYPVIDLRHGGTVNGVIAALNRILDIAVPARYQEGGTYVIPGHGRLCDEADVVEYRDMVTIVRDRVQDMIQKGMTLEQVQAARPSLDYDTEYGASSGFWTTAMFVDAVYRSLREVEK
jgi:glyoxylase-like metal-dependent hydrolase (beta-lactamase superfamily II)